MQNYQLRAIRALVLTSTAICALSVSQLALAQKNTADGAEASTNDDGNIKDIIVTARRREERLQSVPISATAYDAANLEQRNIQSTQDLFGQVPSLVVGGSGQSRSSENITIRGQGATFSAAPGVVLYFAEVPIIADQRNNAQNAGGANYYDLASVQVLRGPQGTLFGRNTTGGAVLFEPQKPTGEFGGNVQFQYGNYNSIDLRGAINVPIVEDTLMVRVAGVYQKRDGFTQEITTNTDLDDRNRYSLRAGLTWRLADGVENYLMATMTNVDEHGSSAVLNAVPAGSLNGVPYSRLLADQVARGIRTVRLSPSDWRERARYWSVTDIFSAELSDALTFRNIVNYSRLKTAQPFDADGIPDDSRARFAARQSELGTNEFDPTAFGFYNYSTDVRQLSIEPQFQGDVGDGALTFVVGGFFNDVKPLGPQFTRQRHAILGIRFLPNGEKSDSGALYAQGTLAFGSLSESLSGLRLTGGYRYTWDNLTATSNFVLPNADAVTTAASYKAPTWTAGLDYDAAEDVLLYAKVSRGYKTGGIGRATPAPALRSFRPEFVTAYEAGIKADWNIGGIPLRTNLNYYYTAYRDLQRTGGTSFIYFDPVTGITAAAIGAQTTNAGKAHIQGIEFEGEIRPASWLSLSGNYSHTKAKYDEYTLPSLFPNGIPAFGLPPGFDCGAGVAFTAATGQCELAGIPFQFTPKNQFSLTGRLDLPIDEAAGNISLSATYSYVDAQYTSPSKANAGEPYAWIGGNCPHIGNSVVCGPGDGYGLLSMNLQWQSVMGSNFDLSAFATNLSNETYILSSNGSSYQNGFNTYIYGEPRMYGASVRYHFGG